MPEFAVGSGRQNYGDKGYFKLTAEEWRDPATSSRLLASHAATSGWPLLEDPLKCNDALIVAEGWALVNGSKIVEFGHDGKQQLHGFYPAASKDDKRDWKSSPPSNQNWTIKQFILSASDEPCLYILVVRL